MSGDHLDLLASAVAGLPFVKNHGIELVEVAKGRAVARLPFNAAFATPPDLFPAAMVGMLGDIAAITACSAAGPPGAACSTLDFTVKMTAPARGSHLEAEGTALQAGATTAIGKADIFAVSPAGERRHCAVVLATGRMVGANTKPSPKG